MLIGAAFCRRDKSDLGHVGSDAVRLVPGKDGCWDAGSELGGSADDVLGCA